MAAPVRVQPVVRREISLRVPVVGTVLPVDISRVASATAGPIVEYDHREGDLIEKGQPICKLRTVTLEIELAAARATLQEKQKLLEQFEAGYRPEEIRQSEARAGAAKAESDYTASYAERIKRLFGQAGAVTESERDEAMFNAERARQAFAEAQADYDMKQTGFRPEEIEAARAAVEAQQNAVAKYEDDLTKKTIEAPFTGYLVEKTLEVGEWVEMGASVGTMARLDEVEVRVNVEESSIHEIQVGEEVDVRFDALAGRTIPGTVRQIVPRSLWSAGSRSFPIEVRMTNSIEAGRPLLTEGMVARITFRGTPRTALCVHKDAIVRSTGRPMVFVVDDDQTVRAVDIHEGISDGEFIEVDGELREGDLLVTEGVERLKPYDSVAILNADEAAQAEVAKKPVEASSRPTETGG